MQAPPSFLLHCNAVKLARKDGLFGKSDPFVVIKAYGKPVGYSNVVKKDLNPTWKPIAIDAASCGGLYCFFFISFLFFFFVFLIFLF